MCHIYGALFGPGILIIRDLKKSRPTCRHTHLQRKKLPLAKVVRIETCLFNTDYKHQYLTVTNSMTSQLSQRCRDTMASPQPDCLVSPSWMRTTVVIVITHQWEHVTRNVLWRQRFSFVVASRPRQNQLGRVRRPAFVCWSWSKMRSQNNEMDLEEKYYPEWLCMPFTIAYRDYTLFWTWTSIGLAPCPAWMKCVFCPDSWCKWMEDCSP